MPAIIFHGDRDTTVHPNNGGQVLEQAISTASTQKTVHRGQIPGGHEYTRTIHTDAGGRGIMEHWNIHGAAHVWSGGSPAGSYTDQEGPDATREMLRFFLEHALAGCSRGPFRERKARTSIDDGGMGSPALATQSSNDPSRVSA